MAAVSLSLFSLSFFSSNFNFLGEPERKRRDREDCWSFEGVFFYGRTEEENRDRADQCMLDIGEIEMNLDIVESRFIVVSGFAVTLLTRFGLPPLGSGHLAAFYFSDVPHLLLVLSILVL